jgi:hypothetical protein
VQRTHQFLEAALLSLTKACSKPCGNTSAPREQVELTMKLKEFSGASQYRR